MDYLSAIQKLAVQLRKRNHRNEELTVGKHHWKIEKQPEWYVKAVRKTIAALPGGYAEAADWLDVTENALFNRLRADGDQIFPLGWAMVLQRAGGTSQFRSCRSMQHWSTKSFVFQKVMTPASVQLRASWRRLLLVVEKLTHEQFNNTLPSLATVWRN